MNPIKALIGKVNHKKCMRAWTKTENQIKYQDAVIIPLSTTEGYDEYFDKLKEKDLDYRIDDSMRDMVYVYVTRKKAVNLWIK